MTPSLFEEMSEGGTPDMCLPEDPEWHRLTAEFFSKEEGRALKAKLKERLSAGAAIYPPRPFRALDGTPFSSVKVVIVGQDPYHGPGQAEGLAFSVPDGIRVPPSLRNIKKELARDLGVPMTQNGSLWSWAGQGVLLINAILTVEDGKPASHRKWGWETLTDELIRTVSEKRPAVVFLLWGNFAQSKRHLIDESRHLVLCANHPSPLSASRPPVPFIGCGHFSEANRWLTSKGESEINWSI